jgi:hypothetical protein
MTNCPNAYVNKNALSIIPIVPVVNPSASFTGAFTTLNGLRTKYAAEYDTNIPASVFLCNLSLSSLGNFSSTTLDLGSIACDPIDSSALPNVYNTAPPSSSSNLSVAPSSSATITARVRVRVPRSTRASTTTSFAHTRASPPPDRRASSPRAHVVVVVVIRTTRRHRVTSARPRVVAASRARGAPRARGATTNARIAVAADIVAGGRAPRRVSTPSNASRARVGCPFVRMVGRTNGDGDDGGERRKER